VFAALRLLPWTRRKNIFPLGEIIVKQGDEIYSLTGVPGNVYLGILPLEEVAVVYE